MSEERLGEDVFSKEVQDWAGLLLLHSFAISELKTKLENLDEEFRLTKDYNPIEHIRYRVKKSKSIQDKLTRLGLDVNIKNARENIFDIAGIRIICAFTADIYMILEILKEHPSFKVVQIKDYITNPKPNGYKSLHLHIEYPVYLSVGVIPVRVEIQLRTIAMDFWASIEHKIYYRYRDKAPKMIQSELKSCAELISNLDDRMYNLKKIISNLDKNTEKDEYKTKADIKMQK